MENEKVSSDLWDVSLPARKNKMRTDVGNHDHQPMKLSDSGFIPAVCFH